MRRYILLQVDAFTDRPLGGNPCAVVLDAEDLDDDTMLAIARETNLSETAFVLPSKVADVGARYFTPTEEIPMAGHPTLATVAALVDAGRLPLREGVQRVHLELPVGPIPVDLECRDGRLEAIVMGQPRPTFLTVWDGDEVAGAFGLATADLRDDLPVQTVSTGTPQLLIPVRSLEALRGIHVDLPAYTRLREGGDFFSVHPFCTEGITSAGATFARHFSPPPRAAEDPFTGSATGCMGAYLWHHGWLDSPRFVAEQGHWMSRPGEATVEVLGAREAIEGVRVGGGAVVVMRGELAI